MRPFRIRYDRTIRRWVLLRQFRSREPLVTKLSDEFAPLFAYAVRRGRFARKIR